MQIPAILNQYTPCRLTPSLWFACPTLTEKVTLVLPLTCDCLASSKHVSPLLTPLLSLPAVNPCSRISPSFCSSLQPYCLLLLAPPLCYYSIAVPTPIATRPILYPVTLFQSLLTFSPSVSSAPISISSPQPCVHLPPL